MAFILNERYGKTKVLLPGGGVPVFLQSSGTVGDNGALSGLTALPLIFPSIYLYFPANAISAGSAAGLYYCVMSSTTAGTIYNNTYTTRIPTIPASPTAFVTTGPGAYTQTTGADITLVSATVPGNSMRLNGSLKVSSLISNNNSAGAKVIKYLLATTNFGSFSGTTTVSEDLTKYIANAGSESIQYLASSSTIGGGSGVNISASAINTAVDTTLSLTGQIAVATDFVGFIRYNAEVMIL